MRQVSGQELARVLERHGWSLIRIHSSHYIYSKAGSNVRLSVPVHGNRPLRIGLQAHLIKMAGLTDADLE